MFASSSGLHSRMDAVVIDIRLRLKLPQMSASQVDPSPRGAISLGCLSGREWRHGSRR